LNVPGFGSPFKPLFSSYFIIEPNISEDFANPHSDESQNEDGLNTSWLLNEFPYSTADFGG